MKRHPSWSIQTNGTFARIIQYANSNIEHRQRNMTGAWANLAKSLELILEIQCRRLDHNLQFDSAHIFGTHIKPLISLTLTLILSRDVCVPDLAKNWKKNTISDFNDNLPICSLSVSRKLISPFGLFTSVIRVMAPEDKFEEPEID